MDEERRAASFLHDFAINELKTTAATLLVWFDLELLSNEVPSFDLSRTGFGPAGRD